MKPNSPWVDITYLGLLIDTEKMIIQIPDEKVQELLYFLNEASNRKKINSKYVISFKIFPCSH
jgi:hypothetical protein